MSDIAIGVVDPKSIRYSESRSNIRNPENPETGKRYFPSSARYEGGEILDPDEGEVSDYKWVSFDSAVNALSNDATKARSFAIEVLKVVNSKLTKQIVR